MERNAVPHRRNISRGPSPFCVDQRRRGRSISAFDLHAGLTACQDLLVRYGGHRAAAGITIQADRLDAFTQRFNGVARERLTPDDLVPPKGVLLLGVQGCGKSLAAKAVAGGFGVLVQLVIVFVNDFADRETDARNTTFSRFSGGSRVLPEGRIAPARSE